MKTQPDKNAVAFTEMRPVIDMYNKAASSGERKLKKQADRALKSIVNGIDGSIPVCMEDGLCGIGY
jgi:hypothetical protein